MAFGKKIFKSKHLTWHRFLSPGASRRGYKNFRKKLGLTSKNKFARQLRRSIKGLGSSSLPSSSPTSAFDLGGYKYEGRSISQLMGGV